MILTGPEIIQQVRSNRIRISPFDKDLVNPNSYNYRLSNELYVLKGNVLDAKKATQWEQITFNKSGFMLRPGFIYLSSTFEKIGSDHYVVSLIGRSSLGRLGLFLQITADLGQLGTYHAWTLELTVVQPIRIYPYMRIGQVSFWEPIGQVSTYYRQGYSQYSSPHQSEFHHKI